MAATFTGVDVWCGLWTQVLLCGNRVQIDMCYFMSAICTVMKMPVSVVV